ncbi:uncharacterized protein KY384_001138 [Bacidia gigantensis]|uniref:uncharacterized protein n=1 Tax=Bacidia gigantensis TaxID=2732470 RepID=UPI001D037463|nr:uncharacterized protein KY384_001138 [Bacidia gigantensis]KAG8534294.1 hypothetical protein KY384_001138 [Bacidia gigantensis]
MSSTVRCGTMWKRPIWRVFCVLIATLASLVRESDCLDPYFSPPSQSSIPDFHHRTAQSLNQALWTDVSKESFYAYDGSVSGSIPFSQQPAPPSNQLWQFTPSGNSGAWSQISPPALSNFSSLVRRTNGIYASGGDLGFALGGYQNSGTNTVYQSLGDYYEPPGLTVYNTTSQQWLNVSSAGYSNNGVCSEGTAHFVSMFGSAGLFLVLGGKVANGVLPGFDTVSIFDPTSQQWAVQEVSGSKPAPVFSHCAVGVAGDNDTYEIFLFGGRSNDLTSTISQGAVFVLSLPAFHWEKQDVIPDTGRYIHSCNVIGKRQMFVMGGRVLNASSNVESVDSIADPWDKGIGVFDLTVMEWKDGYDADAPAYTTPDTIKAWYQKNGPYPVSWSNSQVQDWFTKANTTATVPPAATTQKPHGSLLDVGSIAGSTFGGVVGLGLYIVLLVYIYRINRQKRQLRESNACNSLATRGENQIEQGEWR